LDSFLLDVPFCRPSLFSILRKKHLSTRNSIIHHETGIREELFTMELLVEYRAGSLSDEHLRQ